jgi:hypothetical protein
MKIFISHSSKDKWAARRISEDLISLGAITFLDEKDIETGQSIDHKIQKNLKDCDDFLIILSPASIKSEWVLIELGGALALEKKIIPILLYVGANEIPQVINLKLARDINSINLYYDEAKQLLKGAKVQVALSKASSNKDTAFKVGDKVRIVSKKPENVMRNSAIIDWEPAMDYYLSQEMIINSVSENVELAYTLENAKLSGTNSHYVFAEEWLIPIQS